LEGGQVARTFWGKAWCDHLESHSDYANRLPRGRSYLRNGSVIDLQIDAGRVTAQVSGSRIYQIAIAIKPLAKARWTQIRRECSGQVTSLIDLLQGKLSADTMKVVTHPENGLFPKPSEISLECSCPDWADMCKHVAAALYGVGARLDEDPSLLFRLRAVDHAELIDCAAEAVQAPAAGGSAALAESELSEVFGIELDQAPASAKSSSRAAAGPKRTIRPGKAKPAAEGARRRSQDRHAKRGATDPVALEPWMERLIALRAAETMRRRRR
jgi:uncharacterized Zn finger protein